MRAPSAEDGRQAAQPSSAPSPNAFKPNINLVVIDWLIRHGHIPPEAPGYLGLVAALRQGSCC